MPDLSGRSRLPLRAAGLAALSGARSTAGLALLARAARRGRLPGLRGTVFERLGSRRVADALLLALLGELIADKTPFVPARTAPGPLFGRALSGALVGAALFAAERRCRTRGALLGAACAAAGAFITYGARGWATRETGMPDPIAAAAEDALVVSVGRRLLGLD